MLYLGVAVRGFGGILLSDDDFPRVFREPTKLLKLKINKKI